MTLKALIPLAAAALPMPAPAAAADPPEAAAEEEARIPFLHLGRMRTFRTVGDDTLYVRSRSREWYRIETMGWCRNLRWAHHIGVDTNGSLTFDRFSTLIVDGDRCAIRSVVRSGEPPRRRR